MTILEVIGVDPRGSISPLPQVQVLRPSDIAPVGTHHPPSIRKKLRGVERKRQISGYGSYWKVKGNSFKAIDQALDVLVEFNNIGRVLEKSENYWLKIYENLVKVRN